VTATAACRILLIGMMGSGKSTIGRMLAAATGWPYLDNDDLVRRSHGTTARRILAERGEAEMRAAESEALSLGVAVQAPAVIGVAAGTILDPDDRERLRSGGVVVWLRADAEALESRAIGADHRPWVGAGGGDWIREAVAERDPLYAAVADIVVDTGQQNAEASAKVVLDRLSGIAACREALRPDAPLERDP
jgi:shikimate kinase